MLVNLSEEQAATIEAELDAERGRLESQAANWPFDHARQLRYNNEIARIDSALSALRQRRDAPAVAEWEPAWSQAPEWAQWWAADTNGAAYWFGKQPEVGDGSWLAKYPCEWDESRCPQWRQTLRRRPAAPQE